MTGQPDGLPRNWIVRLDGKGWNHNEERTMHHMVVAQLTAQWRADAGWAIREAKIPHLDAVTIEVVQRCRTAKLPDPAAAAGWTKAVIDALVDCDVIDDDDGTHVGWIRFWPPRKTGRDGLTLRICEYSSIGT